ncbi:hypothetical protein HDU98_001937 [Podochytrium sp. JEL0797]|nr:hypothetical protein HDU98_001937 [Podochytrium sp. JEL0797]
MERYTVTKPIDARKNIWVGTDNQTGEQVCMKMIEISRDETENDKVRMEAYAMRELSPVNPKRVINFRAFYVNTEQQQVIVMERAFCTVQDVLAIHNKISESDAKVVIYGVLEALVTCHSRYFVHCDIKPSNLFLFSDDLNSVKLGDFGICSEDNGYSSVGGIKGSRGYMAPEITDGQRYGLPVDMYSLGQTLCQLIGAPETPLAASFIKSLISKNPSLRPTALQALQHPWMQGVTAKTSAPFTLTKPAPKVTPEEIPDFPEWLKLNPEDGSDAYYFNQVTRDVQYQHPGGRKYDIAEIERKQTMGTRSLGTTRSLTAPEKRGRGIPTMESVVGLGTEVVGAVAAVGPKLKDFGSQMMRGFARRPSHA